MHTHVLHVHVLAMHVLAFAYLEIIINRVLRDHKFIVQHWPLYHAQIMINICVCMVLASITW